MHGLTRGEMLQMCHKDRNGVHVPYQERDMRYGITQGYLRKGGGGLVAQRGALHREPVGTGRRGVGWGWGRGSEERQEAGSSNTARTEPGKVAHSSTEKG